MTGTHDDTDAGTCEEWKELLEWRLAREPGMTRTAIDEVLDEVTAHCADAGQHPQDAFGPPEEFAARSARERIPLAERARRDRAGLSPADHLLAGVSTTAVLLVAGALLVLVDKGLWFHVTPAGLTGSVLLTVSLQTAWATRALYSAGRLRSAAVVAGGTAALAVTTAVAFTALPDDRIGRLPSPVLALAGVLLGAVSWRLEGSGSSGTAGSRPPVHPGSGAGDAASAECAPTLPEHGDSERWLRRLGELLTGRHKVPRRRTGELVAEARGHLAATGRPPAEEFGPVEVYALQLAEHAGPRMGWTRDEWQLPLFTLVVLAMWLLDLAEQDFNRLFWIKTLVLAGCSLRCAAGPNRRRFRRNAGR